MDKKEENNIIDAEYSEEKLPVHLSVSECAKIINETDTTTRYWCDYFDKILHIKRNGRNRSIDERTLKILQDIHFLRREEKYTMEQTYSYIKERYVDNTKVIKEIPKNNNDLFINAISNEITKNLSKSLNIMSENLIENISSVIQNQNKMQNQNKEELKKYIDDALSNNFSKFKSTLDTKEFEFTKKDSELISSLKNILQKREYEYEKRKNKSLFTRIFHKHKS